MTTERRAFTITCVRRHPEHGYWTAHVTPLHGRPVRVDRRYGSWQSERQRVRREVLPDVARELQARVRVLERRERDAGAPAQLPLAS